MWKSYALLKKKKKKGMVVQLGFFHPFKSGYGMSDKDIQLPFWWSHGIF